MYHLTLACLLFKGFQIVLYIYQCWDNWNKGKVILTWRIGLKGFFSWIRRKWRSLSDPSYNMHSISESENNIIYTLQEKSSFVFHKNRILTKTFLKESDLDCFELKFLCSRSVISTFCQVFFRQTIKCLQLLTWLSFESKIKILLPIKRPLE